MFYHSCNEGTAMSERDYVERRRSVISDKDKQEIIDGVTKNILEQAPEMLWGAMYQKAGKSSFKIAFALIRYGIVFWIASSWSSISAHVANILRIR